MLITVMVAVVIARNRNNNNNKKSSRGPLEPLFKNLYEEEEEEKLDSDALSTEEIEARGGLVDWPYSKCETASEMK